MYTTYSQVPFYRKNWFAILTFFLVTPIFLLVLFTGPVYYQKNGELRAYGKGVRWAFAIFVGLALISTIVGVPKSTTATAQQASRRATPSPAASSTSQPSEQEAMEASRRDSANQTAPTSQPDTQFVGVGPSIKGMQLGLSDTQVRSAVLQNVKASEAGLPLEQHYRYRVIAASDIQNAVTEYQHAASQPYSVEGARALDRLPAQLSQKLQFNYSDAAQLNTHFQNGMWLVFWQPTGTVVLAVHYSADRSLVDWYQIDGQLSVKLFGTESMSNQDFAQAIANNYNIPSLDPGQPDAMDVKMAGAAAMRGVNYDVAIPYHYESDSGWRIDVKGKTITVSQATPQSQRFN